MVHLIDIMIFAIYRKNAICSRGYYQFSDLFSAAVIRVRLLLKYNFRCKILQIQCFYVRLLLKGGYKLRFYGRLLLLQSINHHIDKTNDISLQRQLTLNTYFSYYHYQNPLTQLSKICTLVATFTTWITNYKSLLEDSIFNRYLPRLLLV